MRCAISHAHFAVVGRQPQLVTSCHHFAPLILQTLLEFVPIFAAIDAIGEGADDINDRMPPLTIVPDPTETITAVFRDDDFAFVGSRFVIGQTGKTSNAIWYLCCCARHRSRLLL